MSSRISYVSRIAAGLTGLLLATLLALLEPSAALAPAAGDASDAPVDVVKAAITTTIRDFGPARLDPEAFGDWDHSAGG